MAIKRKYRLNLRNYGNLPAIMLSQYDEGYALEFEIRDGTDAASDLSAYTVTLKGTRADTLAYSFAGTVGTVSTNVLTFVIDTTMTACAGRGTAEIAIKDTANDVLFATFNMPVFVERAAVPEGSIDADVERAQEIAEQVQEIVDNAAAAVSGEAEKWATGQIDGTDVPSTDPAYENNAKYYAEQAETAAASIGIDATLTQAGKAADAKKTGDEISELKEDLNIFSDVVEGYNLIDPTTIIDGEYWTGANPASGSYSRTPLIAVKPNTAYTFANTEANYWDTSKTRARTIVYFKSDGTYISPRTENTGNFTTPENCAFVGISFLQNARNVILIEGTYDITAQTMMYIPYVSPDRQVNGDDINGLSIGSVIDYGKTGKNLFDKSKATSGFLTTYPGIFTNDISFVSDYIPVKANVSYVISNAYVYGARDFSIRSYVLYDVKHQKVSGESGDVKTKVVTPTVDGYLRFCGYNEQKDWTQVEVGSTPTAFEPYKIVLNDDALLNEQQIEQVGNILYRKKWVVCGDSFTAGSESALLTEGRYIGRPVTYPWIIGNRNDMDILKFFEGGRTLAFPANPDTFTNSLTNPNASFYYQNIPADVDYITIYLGINDEHHAPNSSGGDGEDNTGEIPIGTVDDTTVNTYLGAWNVVLTWLITNRPNAHIGIIVTNGIQAHDEYRQGQIAIAEKYGIPYIDLNGDARTPAMIRTSNPNIPSVVKQALVTKWAVDPSTNTHPKDDAHLFESTFIENFLRSI